MPLFTSRWSMVTSNNIAFRIKIWQIMHEESCITPIKWSYPESRITQIITSPKLSSLLRTPSLRAARNVKVKQMPTRDDDPRAMFTRRSKRKKPTHSKLSHPMHTPTLLEILIPAFHVQLYQSLWKVAKLTALGNFEAHGERSTVVTVRVSRKAKIELVIYWLS